MREVALAGSIALCVIVSFCVAYKDIKLSAKMMLIFEAVSLLFILVLARSGYPEALCFLRPLSPITCWFGYS
jgi:hypothetical protein